MTREFGEIFDLVDEIDHMDDPRQTRKGIEYVHEVETLGRPNPGSDFLADVIGQRLGIIVAESVDKSRNLATGILNRQIAIAAQLIEKRPLNGLALVRGLGPIRRDDPGAELLMNIPLPVIAP